MINLIMFVRKERSLLHIWKYLLTSSYLFSLFNRNDLVVLEGSNSLVAFLCKMDESKKLEDQIKCTRSPRFDSISLPKDSLIHSVIPVDFNYDGIIDFAVYFKAGSGSAKFDVWVYLGSSDPDKPMLGKKCSSKGSSMYSN